ncbi:hypothetical protein Bhyg_10178, partial [Pseudolycoriella hygida]
MESCKQKHKVGNFTFIISLHVNGHRYLGNQEKVEQLIERGVDINENQNGWVALLKSVKRR